MIFNFVFKICSSQFSYFNQWLKKTKLRGSGATRKVDEIVKFPRKEEGKKEKETERRGTEGKERKGGRGKKGDKGKGTEWGGIMEKKKKAS